MPDSKNYRIRKSHLGWPEVIVTDSGMMKKLHPKGPGGFAAPVDYVTTHPAFSEISKDLGPLSTPVSFYEGDPGPFTEGHERFHAGQLMTHGGGLKDEMLPPDRYGEWKRKYVPIRLDESRMYTTPQYETPAYLFGSRPMPPGDDETTFKPGSESDRDSYLELSGQGWEPLESDVVTKRPVVQQAFNAYMGEVKQQYPDSAYYLEANSPEWLMKDYLRTTPQPGPRQKRPELREIGLGEYLLKRR
jgi:hypothetical protein